jgi:hypothetical protein
MWYFSRQFVNLPFSSIRNISIVLFMLPSMCLEFRMCCAYVNMFLLCELPVCVQHIFVGTSVRFGPCVVEGKKGIWVRICHCCNICCSCVDFVADICVKYWIFWRPFLCLCLRIFCNSFGVLSEIYERGPRFLVMVFTLSVAVDFWIHIFI